MPKSTATKRRARPAGTAGPTASVASRPPARRSRLAPEARAAQILDTAARLLLTEGFTEVSMERLGREAGISKALVYNYFPSRNDVLRALLTRENALLRERQLEAVRTAKDFPEMIRLTTRLYIEQTQQRGQLVRRLWAEPAVARAMEKEQSKGRERALRYLVREVTRIYGLPPDVALPAVDMQMAMTEVAAQHLPNAHDDVDFATDICVTLLLGGLDALAKQYAKSNAAKTKVKSARSKPTRKA